MFLKHYLTAKSQIASKNKQTKNQNKQIKK